MLAQRRRRWANINSTLNKYIKFAWESESGKLHPLPSGLYCRPNTKGDLCHCRTRDNGRMLGQCLVNIEDVITTLNQCCTVCVWCVVAQ